MKKTLKELNEIHKNDTSGEHRKNIEFWGTLMAKITANPKKIEHVKEIANREFEIASKEENIEQLNKLVMLSYTLKTLDNEFAETMLEKIREKQAEIFKKQGKK